MHHRPSILLALAFAPLVAAGHGACTTPEDATATPPAHADGAAHDATPDDSPHPDGSPDGSSGGMDATTQPDTSGNGGLDASGEADTDAAPDTGGSGGSGAGLPYPTRSAYRIKGIQPDFWPNLDEISGNNTGGVAMNLVWAAWEPAFTPPPCPQGSEELDGHCFFIDNAIDQAIGAWTSRGVVVTAIVYGVPGWARIPSGCSPVAPGFEIFCAPANPADYGRFARFVARRYDGLHGHGRVADFVIHNEVNANDWFDVGCGKGTPCDPSAWIDQYARNYSEAYDAITSEQSEAKVLVSLEHHFGASFDDPAGFNPILSGQTLLSGLAARIGPRAWRVAYHPYPPNLLAPEFGPDDWPRVTYGNIGTLVGWLRKTFPGTPSAWVVQLTESGVNSLPPSSQAAQADGVCRSFRNILGTPGIESYIYHRMKDHPAETAAGLGLGLHDETGQAKQAWAVWALANRNDLSPPQLSCGFEDLPHTRLTRSYHPSRGHWTSSRLPPQGFHAEQSWLLSRDPIPDSTLLFECRADDHNLISPDPGCEGLLPMGPVGYAQASPAPNMVALYRCRIAQGTDHFVSTDPGCEGQTTEQLLGYALP
jgi:hypothetical protein